MEYVNMALKATGSLFLLFSIYNRIKGKITEEQHAVNSQTGLLLLILGSV